MVDTVRAISDLLTNRLNDNTNREITPQDIRDMLVSIVSRVEMPATKTTTYTAGNYDGHIRCDATGGAFTVTLPAAASIGAGKHYTIKKIDASGNAVTVDGNGAETIDGATTYSLTAQYKFVHLVCNGAGWDIIGAN